MDFARLKSQLEDMVSNGDDYGLSEAFTPLRLKPEKKIEYPVETLFTELDKIVELERLERIDRENKHVHATGQAYADAMSTLKMIPKYLEVDDIYGASQLLWTANQKFRTYSVGVLDIAEYERTPDDFMENVYQMDKNFLSFRLMVRAALECCASCVGVGFI